MWNKLRKNTLLKTYYHLPLWGKIAVPAGLLFLASALISMMKTIFGIALIGLAVYLVVSFYLYVRKRNLKRTK